MNKLIFALTCALMTSVAQADGHADQRHFVGSGLRHAIGSGPAVNYSIRLTNQLMVGSSFAYLWDKRITEGGSLDTAQFYRDDYEHKMWMLDVTATFYFREDGYLKWGPLIRGAVGHAHSQAKGWWGRYDRDPAWIVIGDGKRLLESGEDSKQWGSTYARFGAYYQFTFNTHEGAPVSHVLEIGAGGVCFDSRRTISYTKPNGEYFSRDITNVNPTFEINYSLAF